MRPAVSDAGFVSDLPGFTTLFYSSDGVTFNPLASATSVTGDQIVFALSGALLADGYYTIGSQVPEPSACAIWVRGCCDCCPPGPPGPKKNWNRGLLPWL